MTKKTKRKLDAALKGEDRIGGVAGAGNGTGLGSALSGPSEPDLHLEEAASGSGVAGL